MVPFNNVTLLAACVPEIVMVLAPVASLPAEKNRSSDIVVVVAKVAAVPLLPDVVHDPPAVDQVPVTTVPAPAVAPLVSQYKLAANRGASAKK
jgi:hypothetical protein